MSEKSNYFSILNNMISHFASTCNPNTICINFNTIPNTIRCNFKYAKISHYLHDHFPILSIARPLASDDDN